MPPGAPLIHLFSTQMPPGAGGRGETAEGALSPLSPAGTWQGSSGPPRRPGSPEDSQRDTSYSPRSPAGLLGLTHHPPSGKVAPSGSTYPCASSSWGLLNLVTHDGSNICRGAPRERGASFLPGSNQPAWVQIPSLPPLSWAIVDRVTFLHGTVSASVTMGEDPCPHHYQKLCI